MTFFAHFRIRLIFKGVDNHILMRLPWTQYTDALILLDMQMPHLDGKSVTEKIRHIERQEKSEPVPIIGLSAHALDAVRKRCEEVGMNAFLVKPIQMDDVLLVLEEECFKDMKGQ